MLKNFIGALHTKAEEAGNCEISQISKEYLENISGGEDRFAEFYQNAGQPGPGYPGAFWQQQIYKYNPM